MANVSPSALRQQFPPGATHYLRCEHVIAALRADSRATDRLSWSRAICQRSCQQRKQASVVSSHVVRHHGARAHSWSRESYWLSRGSQRLRRQPVIHESRVTLREIRDKFLIPACPQRPIVWKCGQAWPLDPVDRYASITLDIAC
jgi:hypothetical protein